MESLVRAIRLHLVIMNDFQFKRMQLGIATVADAKECGCEPAVFSPPVKRSERLPTIVPNDCRAKCRGSVAGQIASSYDIVVIIVWYRVVSHIVWYCIILIVM